MKKIFVMSIFLWFCSVLNSQPTKTDIPWPSLCDSPWPMMAHDPQFTGRSAYGGPQTATVKWEKDITGSGITFGPVINHENLLLYGTIWDSPNRLVCTTASGEVLWE